MHHDAYSDAYSDMVLKGKQPEWPDPRRVLFALHFVSLSPMMSQVE